MRILERIGCKKHKVELVAEKAYRSKNEIRKSFLTRRKFNGYDDPRIHYTVFQGCVFVWCLDGDREVLITALVNEHEIKEEYIHLKKHYH